MTEKERSLLEQQFIHNFEELSVRAYHKSIAAGHFTNSVDYNKTEDQLADLIISIMEISEERRLRVGKVVVERLRQRDED